MRIIPSLVFIFLASACDKSSSSATTAASTSASTSASTAPAAAPRAVSAAAIHAFFPPDVTFSPDKPTGVEAKLAKDGKDVATLTITDGVKAFARAQFDDSTEKVEGFPVAKFSDTQSCVLVKDRFLVKVQSSSLDHEARKALLAKFDLKGLAAL